MVNSRINMKNEDMPQIEVWLDLQEKAEEEKKRRQAEGGWR